MMEDEAVFSVLSKCFAPVEEREWEQLTESVAWNDFLDGARRLLQDDCALGSTVTPLARMHKRCPLQEFVSNEEVKALFLPPTYEEKCLFAARHFTGGLPESALPIESLYTVWSSSPSAETPFSHAKGFYFGDAAQYMSSLVEALGLQVPEMFSGCPDHLALQLDLIAVMLRSGRADEARMFLVERFDWLTAYRLRLLSLGDDAWFYRALVDVLLGIRAQQSPLEESA